MTVAVFAVVRDSSMRQCLLSCGAILVVLLCTSLAQAHYHLLLPSAASGKAEEALHITWTFGHPYEHEFSDVEKPVKLLAVAPDGKATDLLNQLQADKKGEQTAYSLKYAPPRRGDYVLWAEASPVTMESEKVIYQDSVKVICHALESQRGWDQVVGRGLELVPLTRPYGLEPGLVFQAQALLEGKIQGGALVEVERYNPEPPKKDSLPPDEQITRQMKTDPNGILTCSLPDAGWWVITVTIDGGKQEKDGKEFRIKRRSTLLVHVDPKAK
jgi:cobalt/nickel transport protein